MVKCTKVGCNRKMKRMDLKSHMQEENLHFKLEMKHEINELKRAREEDAQEIARLKEQVKRLKEASDPSEWSYYESNDEDQWKTDVETEPEEEDPYEVEDPS